MADATADIEGTVDERRAELETMIAQAKARIARDRNAVRAARAEINVMPRFWSKVDRRGPDECWVWKSYTDQKGYGQFSFRGSPVLTHRLSFEFVHGAIPEGLYVCHHCDNPPCCNPAHLFIGTAADNMHDKVAKGRAKGGGVRGAAQHCAKLTDDKVREIRRLHARGMPLTRIAESYGVTRTAVYCVAARKTWRHVA